MVRYQLDRLRAELLTISMDAKNAAQIHVSLDEIEPEVWRRLVLPARWNLGQLHLAIQAAFNWWNYHLYVFETGGLRYGDTEMLDDASIADGPRILDGRDVRLLDIGQGISFSYLYDFGDNWRHTVVVEQFLSLEVSPRHGSCIAGAGARPPEDVGGVPGYREFLTIMSDPSDPEHSATKRWCGGHFDPDWFDLTVVNKDLRNALRAKVRRRLHQPKPEKSNATTR